MLLIDKPLGISSFGVVSVVRKVSGVKKVGHAGTLDPLASGLLLILVGREETRMAQSLIGHDKTYEVTVRIGERRDTGDMEGAVTSMCDMSIHSTADVAHATEQALREMVGELYLHVPAYSAVKRNGKRLYKLARTGGAEQVETPVRRMTVHNTELLSSVHTVTLEQNVIGYECDVRFDVASGVYIRSLSEELGRRVGELLSVNALPATTARLRRTRIGVYDITDAQGLDEVRSGVLHHRQIVV